MLSPAPSGLCTFSWETSTSAAVNSVWQLTIQTPNGYPLFNFYWTAPKVSCASRFAPLWRLHCDRRRQSAWWMPGQPTCSLPQSWDHGIMNAKATVTFPGLCSGQAVTLHVVWLSTNTTVSWTCRFPVMYALHRAAGSVVVFLSSQDALTVMTPTYRRRCLECCMVKSLN